nr:MAG TPA: cysteine-rich protein [Bacteriophage sp.]
MFYKQFLTIIDALNPEFVNNFDYWLATLPSRSQKNITASVVSTRLEVSYSQAEAILNFSEKQGILERHYLVKCPDCNYNLGTITKDEIAEILLNPQYCDECEEDKTITIDDIYTAYKVIKKPDATESDIAKAIEERINTGEHIDLNFSQADSLANSPRILYESFYSPSESAYQRFYEMRDKLDLDYGDNTTAKGNALEELILEIFKCIKLVKGTNEVKTLTNQFDCTMISGFNSGFLSVFNYFAPYFIIECKNEPEKKPNNTYCNKMLSIMETNEAQFGIVFGRRNAASTCFSISREHYLTNRNLRRQQIIITCSDEDLYYLIDKKVNLLEYIEFKIFQVTSNSPNSTFEMFK